MDTKELTQLKPPMERMEMMTKDSDSMLSDVQKRPINGKLIQLFATLSGALATFTTGQLMGWASPSLPILESDESPIGKITSAEGSWIASLVMVGNMMAVPLVALTVDRIGRKSAVLLSTIPVFLSWFLVYSASTIEMLYVARFVGGIGETYGKATMFMYIGEIAEPRIRGALGTLLVCTLNLGILYEYAIGPFVTYEELAWISGIVPILLLLTFVWMPESPYYFTLRGQHYKAKRALLCLRGHGDVGEELREIRGSVEQRAPYSQAFRILFGNSMNLKCLLLMCGCFVSQEMSGITPNIMYAKSILHDSHLGGLSPAVAPVFIPILKILATLATMVLVDKIGRRPLFMISTSSCAATMGVLSLYFYLHDFTDTPLNLFEWIPLTMMLFFNVMFIFGLGCLPFIMIGELFPANIKALAVCLTAMCGPLSSVVATKMFQILNDSFGKHAAFGAFAICCAISFVFVTSCLPETKNRTLAEIQLSLKK